MQKLNRKLLRDLWRIKGQAAAIAFVIAAGIALFVMSRGMMTSLDETMRAYYERHRFADVYAPVKRAPNQLLAEIRKMDGVNDAEGRINGGGIVDLPAVSAPISARIVSIDPEAQSAINQVYLASGRMIDPLRRNEVLLLRPFADAHGLQPGDEIAATMNGVRQTFSIAGLALSPEFIYALPPGEFVIDAGRFAVMWAGREAMEAAYDLDGAFNEVVLKTSRDSDHRAIIAQLDNLLAPFGATGAFGREDQVSNKYLVEELKQLDTMGRILPPIFLAVSIFLLNIVTTRLVHTEREQIGLIKAFGYTNVQVAAHYMKFVLAIAISGAAIGWAGGVWLGKMIAEIYRLYFHFPFLIFVPALGTLLFAVCVSGAAAIVGALFAVRDAVNLTPAIAMRPPAPPRFKQNGRFSGAIVANLDQPTRMIVRRLSRQPIRAAMTAFGIGAAMALSVMMQFNLAATDHMLDVSFNVADRSDVVVTFTEPLNEKTILELATVAGVNYVEPFRAAPVKFMHNRVEFLGGITGLPDQPVLNRAIDADQRAIEITGDGLWLSRQLADILDIRTGELLRLEVREGGRPEIVVPVLGEVDALIGTPAYMNIHAVSRWLGEAPRVSGAYLNIDLRDRELVYAELKEIPLIAGVSLRREAYENFAKMIDEGPGVFRNIMLVFSIIIGIGVVYNASRIAFIERGRDLASLRVLGFTKIETGYVLLGELAVLAILALPIGAGLGYLLWAYIAKAMSTELYQIPVIYRANGIGVAAVVVLAAAAVAGALVQRDVAKIDLVGALKTRE